MDNLESIKEISLETLKSLSKEIDKGLLPKDEMILEIIEIISKHFADNERGDAKTASEIDNLIVDFVKSNQS